MVVPHIRLWEGRVDEVVCCGVLPFQKKLGGKLVVSLQKVDLGIFKLHILHILHKFAVVIENPLMQEIRYLDKLVDELAKGKAMEKVLRK